MGQEHNSIFNSLYKLLLSGEVFIKCPQCNKSLGLFETCNENCSFCGRIDKNKMIVTEGYITNSENEIITDDIIN